MTSTDDQDLDPLEVQDREEQDEHAPEGELIIEPEKALEEEHELAKELEKVALPDEEVLNDEVALKKASHMLPQELIDKELEPDDLCDDGYI